MPRIVRKRAAPLSVLIYKVSLVGNSVVEDHFTTRGFNRYRAVRDRLPPASHAGYSGSFPKLSSTTRIDRLFTNTSATLRAEVQNSLKK